MAKLLDLPDSIKATAKMFADDTKLYSNISTLADCEALQHDLNKLAVWSKAWLLNFNATKCVVLKIRQSLNYAYTLNGEILEIVEEQKDLGITICKNLKPSTHIKYTTTKANQRIALIKQCFESSIGKDNQNQFIISNLSVGLYTVKQKYTKPRKYNSVIKHWKLR